MADLEKPKRFTRKTILVILFAVGIICVCISIALWGILRSEASIIDLEGRNEITTSESISSTDDKDSGFADENLDNPPNVDPKEKLDRDEFFTIIDPKGIQDDAIAALNSKNDDLILKKFGEIKETPEKFSPPVFFLLSKLFYAAENYENAAFYYYLGQLRTRYDTNRSADPNAGVVADLVSDLWIEFNIYGFQDLDRLETIVLSVVEYDKITAHNYDQRWINGIIPSDIIEITDLKIMSVPEDEWLNLEISSREEFLMSFYEDLDEARSLQEKE